MHMSSMRGCAHRDSGFDEVCGAIRIDANIVRLGFINLHNLQTILVVALIVCIAKNSCVHTEVENRNTLLVQDRLDRTIRFKLKLSGSPLSATAECMPHAHSGVRCHQA